MRAPLGPRGLGRDRLLAAAFVVLVSSAIVGFSSAETGASFTATTTNPGQSWNTATVAAPATQNAAVTAAAGAVNLSWTASPSTVVGTQTMSYLVYRGAVGGPYPTFVNSTSGLTMTDTPPSDGTYEWVVQTKIAQGTGFFTSPNSVARSAMSDRTAPTAATGLLTAKGLSAGQINLSWTAGTDALSGVAGYTIHRSGVVASCPATTTANYPNTVSVGAVTSTTISGLVSLSKYCFYLTTNDVAGNASANSAAVGPAAAK